MSRFLTWRRFICWRAFTFLLLDYLHTKVQSCRSVTITCTMHTLYKQQNNMVLSFQTTELCWRMLKWPGPKFPGQIQPHIEIQSRLSLFILCNFFRSTSIARYCGELYRGDFNVFDGSSPGIPSCKEEPSVWCGSFQDKTHSYSDN